MLTHDVAKTGSYSYKAKYQIYDTLTRTLNPTPLQAPGGNHLLQYAGWGPNSNQLVCSKLFVAINHSFINFYS